MDREKRFAEFTKGLEELSRETGVAIETTGGVVFFDTNKVGDIKYSNNPTSGDLDFTLFKENNDETSVKNLEYDIQSFINYQHLKGVELRKSDNGLTIKLNNQNTYVAMIDTLAEMEKGYDFQWNLDEEDGKTVIKVKNIRTKE